MGFLIILCLYSSAQAFRTTEITDFFDNCPYESEARLMQGDYIYSIDGHRIYLFGDLDLYFNRGDGSGYDLVVLPMGLDEDRSPLEKEIIQAVERLEERDKVKLLALLAANFPYCVSLPEQKK